MTKTETKQGVAFVKNSDFHLTGYSKIQLMLKNKNLAIGALLVWSLLTGCREREEVNPQSPDKAAINNVTKLNNKLYEIMKEVYFWDTQLPATFDGSKYKNPDDALDALTYKAFDRWSYLEDIQTFMAYFEGGQYVGNGLGLKLDAKGDLWVSYVYPGSPAGKAGLARGLKISRINGQDVSALLSSNSIGKALGEDKAGVQTRFSFVSATGQASEATLIKEPVTISSVLYRDVKEVAGKKVGYLVFTTFIDKSNAELDEAFAFFKSKGADEVVLDLRYNGGGSLSVAQHLAGLVAPSKAGQKFVELTYNTQLKELNQRFDIAAQAQGINLNRLFVITSRNTASASEAIINGLRPYLPVITIGSASHGKPVGMNSLPLDMEGKLLEWKNVTSSTKGYAFLPIMFKVANASGQAEYFTGIPADGAAPDELSVPFGDVTEDSFEQALHFIRMGSFSAPLAAAGRRASEAGLPMLPMPGLRAEIGAF
jgi:C-terminal processing protease CtpA/Prc